MYKPGKEQATRIEARFPDPACNFPLAFAAMLAAGLEGIEKEYELPEPARQVLGDHVFDSLVVNQKAEWEEYYLEVRGKDRKHHLVTEYEIERLLPVL